MQSKNMKIRIIDVESLFKIDPSVNIYEIKEIKLFSKSFRKSTK